MTKLIYPPFQGGGYKILSDTECGSEWWNKAKIPKFVIQVSVGACGWDMKVVLEMCPIFVENY